MRGCRLDDRANFSCWDWTKVISQPLTGWTMQISMKIKLLIHFLFFFVVASIQTKINALALSVREVWGSIPGLVKSTLCRQRLATTVTFLRSCVALALSRGDGPRHLLHASVKYREYNEDLIFFLTLEIDTSTHNGSLT